MYAAIRRTLVTLSVVGISLAGNEASANVSAATGYMFKPYAIPSQTTAEGAPAGTTLWNQASASSWGTLQSPVSGVGWNVSAIGIYVQAQVAYPSSKPLSLSGWLSSNDFCYVLETDNGGNVTWSQRTFATNPPRSFVPTPNAQTLNLGTPPAASGHAVSIACYVEPNAGINLAWQ